MSYLNQEEEEYFWDEAYRWAYQRASEEGDVDLDYDDELIHAWAQKYYDDLTNQKG